MTPLELVERWIKEGRAPTPAEIDQLYGMLRK